MLKICTKGISRIVILVGNYAIKIPNFLGEHTHFLSGCYANWSERTYCKSLIYIKDYDNYKKISPSIFCSYLGLIQIQLRCTPKHEPLTKQEIQEYASLHGGDYKKENFGYYNGNLVCLDYGIKFKI